MSSRGTSRVVFVQSCQPADKNEPLQTQQEGRTSSAAAMDWCFQVTVRLDIQHMPPSRVIHVSALEGVQFKGTGHQNTQQWKSILPCVPPHCSHPLNSFCTTNLSVFFYTFTAHNRRPHGTTPAQDLHIKLLHLQDHLRPATWTAHASSWFARAQNFSHARLRKAHHALRFIVVTVSGGQMLTY